MGNGGAVIDFHGQPCGGGRPSPSCKYPASTGKGLATWSRRPQRSRYGSAIGALQQRGNEACNRGRWSVSTPTLMVWLMRTCARPELLLFEAGRG